MTRKELICIASASGVSFYGMGKDRERFMDRLQRFADMVLAAQPSPKPDSAKVKLFNDRMALSEEALTAMKAIAAAEERKACLMACAEDAHVDEWKGLAEAVRRISARGQA
jgi:hypothetical protein